ncbi:WXG100 family type VII secretion target [Actinokineospora bangkokensis]|uniref:PPE family domain-containing protein n=1 Tax=Actinokineospora bangkokensis TaxID=1193682 RepID=A0A1Q9LPA2_9PSEU|nr:hypothetical protein [Actinokineospora bangkokensis]OLR93845.1 hypothetical protein BJP25_16615 [Actinokineospora bangkokensis]
MTGDDLIAQPKGVELLAGTGLGESGFALAKDIGNGSGWQELAVDGFVVGLDALSLVMNPLGEVVKAGVGWLMEHIDFIREPLEVLTGDPAHIEAIAKTWENVAQRIDDMADEYRDAMPLTACWSGDAASGYGRVANGYIAALGQVAAQARDAADGVKVAGVVVATERAIVFDLIATFISDVITRALLALASSWFTCGASVAVFATSVVADAAQLVAKLQKRLGKLLQSIQGFVAKYRVLGDRSADAARSLGRASNELGREANQVIRETTGTLGVLAEHSGGVKKYAGWVERRTDSTLGKALDHNATKVVKEGAKSINDTLNPDD